MSTIFYHVPMTCSSIFTHVFFSNLAYLFHYQGKDGAREIRRLAFYVPKVQLAVESQPITRTILRVKLTIEPDFTWSNQIHGLQQSYWVWIEDPDQGVIFHSEYWTLTKRMVYYGLS